VGDKRSRRGGLGGLAGPGMNRAGTQTRNAARALMRLSWGLPEALAVAVVIGPAAPGTTSWVVPRLRSLAVVRLDAVLQRQRCEDRQLEGGSGGGRGGRSSW
jgi:hypothetical protein